ncbi:hypothetical protein HPB47_027406 [Ixodes persulcatus]|uniref:Uncharacterized protein n=1 Tax=Ixodes persulcatus TaxID=34615 RepID=A0AC60PWI2_IXOPE|nr:hypothetical protein HPB47_027406 [Ixodes persulcatus]
MQRDARRPRKLRRLVKMASRQTFLERFGYMGDTSSGSVLPSDNLRTEEGFRAALRRMQKFAGLPATGRLDQATARMMKARRCGVPDVIGHAERVRRYALQGSKWDKTHLTWRLYVITQIERRWSLDAGGGEGYTLDTAAGAFGGGLLPGHLLAGDFGLFQRRGETCPGANESPERELQVDRKPDLGLRPSRDADEGGPLSLGRKSLSSKQIDTAFLGSMGNADPSPELGLLRKGSVNQHLPISFLLGRCTRQGPRFSTLPAQKCTDASTPSR